MSGRYTGGPAFPTQEKVRGGFGAPSVTVHHPGMTLRDWFAGQVVAGIMTRPNAGDSSAAQVAALAYLIADSMLAERERGQEAPR